MKVKDRILDCLARRREVAGGDLAALLGISRQALNVHLKDLIRQGRVVKEGVTRGASYRLGSGRKGAPLGRGLRKRYLLKGLQEDRVYEEIAMFAGVRGRTTPLAAETIHYAFTEMLNNAIEHSGSRQCLVEFRVDPYDCLFRIRDYGVGLFRSVAGKYRLPDEHSAVGELLKGKTTTMPERHTGEGIFFASKAADTMIFRSHALTLLFDNVKNDVLMEEKRFIRGTEVSFRISRKSRRRLGAVFAEFAPERHDYRFEKTRVLVRLFQKEYVSRSEARRLLAGLDKFKEIELDFAGVTSLGQGFVDEVFRVFAGANPGIDIRTVHLRPSLEPILRHGIDNKT